MSFRSSLEGKLIGVFGPSSDTASTVHVYDPAAAVWRQIDVTLGSIRSGVAIGTTGGLGVIFLGAQTTGLWVRFATDDVNIRAGSIDSAVNPATGDYFAAMTYDYSNDWLLAFDNDGVLLRRNGSRIGHLGWQKQEDSTQNPGLRTLAWSNGQLIGTDSTGRLYVRGPDWQKTPDWRTLNPQAEQGCTYFRSITTINGTLYGATLHYNDLPPEIRRYDSQQKQWLKYCDAAFPDVITGYPS